ncbi:hypothetical protein L3Q82_010872, partial [Scortum barcoo]
QKNITMTEAKDQASFAVSRQIPDALHIDLPDVDPVQVWFTINKCLIQTRLHWESMADGFVTCAVTTSLASCCMDMIQTFAEAILDVVMPQVYKYMGTYGPFSSTILDLTEDRIFTYLGDFIEQVLDNFVKVKLESTKVFCELLLRHISRTVNSVLVLTTQTPIVESRLPVFFVSGCVTSVTDLKNMVCQIATLLIEAFKAQNPALENGLKTLTRTLNSRHDLKKLVTSYLMRMVKVLKRRTQMPLCKKSSRNHRHVCIRVGTLTEILTVEDSESPGQYSAMSSFSDLDALPGGVPESSNHYDSCPFSSHTIICATEDHSPRLAPSEMESIDNIADDLVQAFLEVDLQDVMQTDSGRLEVMDNVNLREITVRLFSVIMKGHHYQIPVVPAGRRMCDTVTYRQLYRGGVADQSVIAHTLYLRTEEIIVRCALQVLLWSALRFDCPSTESSDEIDDLVFLFGPRQEGGDYLNDSFESIQSLSFSSQLDQHSDTTYDVASETGDITESYLITGILRSSFLNLLVGEMLAVMGITTYEAIFEVVTQVIDQFHGVNAKVYDHFSASLLGHSYKEMYQTVIADLREEYCSVEEMQEVVRAGDPSFVEAIIRSLRK